MNFNFFGKKISSVITILPENESCFDDEMPNYNFPERKSKILKELMGYNKHKIAADNQLASDFIIAGFKRLFEDKVVEPEDIDVLIYITQSPDYLVPQTSTIIQDQIGLKKDILCFDLNQGCAGFIHGLFQAFFMLENPSINKVAIANSDVLSHKVNKKDRNSYPLVGDGGSIVIVERSEIKNEIFCFNKTFGENALAISIPAGGFKLPSTDETAKDFEDEDGNIRSLNNLVMQGASVFSFVQEYVPIMIESLFEKSKLEEKDIDFFIFHQPNKFMLEKLADKLKIPHEKMPNNIVENFGNGSGITIPLNMCFNLNDRLSKEGLKICFGGFGVGLTLAGIIMDVEKIPYMNLISLKD
ncbi:ketoacyl-ACP synthase III [Helicobacter cappadocius]|uniref:Ketoacyl-ACP synthase III n=1 Tax=Helicobacter cappadocius TaxID=3063998 RepID=A0AA90PSL1_9HELI|nr:MULTISPECIES: ketoacyl-ACP synthase III [unclassified Helicobacter]MDO7253940.1 ketoacyl-ACP synthase III [Helicobacter sp. faydin-H75]MDP2538694.1 ketoacyl-ACP synthase III [Helicobacter sp. faydin-H76]